jgi:hypothetical protein
MTDKKTLNQWHDSGEINHFQKEMLTNFGIDDTYPSYAFTSLEKLLQWQEIIARSKPNIPGQIQKMIFFSAWWNRNLIIVINQEKVYGIYLIIHELSSGDNKIPGTLEIKQIDGSTCLENAESKVHELEKKLNSDKPILYGSPTLRIKYDEKYRFKEVQVFTFPLPFGNLKKNPDNYIKPLDIVKNCWKQKENEMLHSGIYLGQRKVCHARPTSYYYDGCYNGPGKIEITDWTSFLSFTAGNAPYKLIRSHPLVPYQKQVIEYLAKAVIGSTKYYEKKGEFDIKKNNCEQFVNLVTYGINVSEQVEMRKVQGEDKEGREIKSYSLENKITESQNFFNSLTNSEPEGKIKEIKKYVSSPHHTHGTEMEERVEVQPKSCYRMFVNKK